MVFYSSVCKKDTAHGVWNKKFWTAASISFDESLLRSSQLETFKKGHKKILAYTTEKMQTFSQSMANNISKLLHQIKMKRVIKNIILVI